MNEIDLVIDEESINYLLSSADETGNIKRNHAVSSGCTVVEATVCT